KPAISASTGTSGSMSAPIYATLENVFSVVMMGMAYILAKTNPWLLVAIFFITAALIVGMVIYAVTQLRKLKVGIGKVLNLAQTNPRAGLAVAAECFVWGIGWLTWQQWGRGVLMLFFLALWAVIFFIAQPMFVALFAFFPPLLPLVGFLSIMVLLIVYFSIGLRSSARLMRFIEMQLTGQPAEVAR
ncbi:MAG: hypothetical protein AAGU05_15485, partial [Anaerolineaceae bacterium]